jgi:polyisoprenoid-binding protein YceI
MIARRFVVPALALASAALLSLTPAAHSGSPAAGAYKIDPTHSSVVFRIKHMNTAPFYGTFEKVTGTINFDESNPGSSSINAEIPVDSVHTHADKRDAHLKSKDFFNAESFPTLSFKSKSFTKSGDAYEVTGDLTLHGVTKPITARVEKTGSGSMQGKELIGFDVSFTVKRSDFGITFMPDGLGDEVKVMIGLEANR